MSAAQPLPAAGPLPAPGVAEPTARVGRRWIALLSLANLGLWMGYFGPLQVLLPNQVQDIDEARKTVLLGIVTAIGAVVAVVAGPVAGILSDRSVSRFGRRHAYIVGGAVVGALALALLAGQHTLVGVTVGWCLAQAGLNALQAGATAVVPDQVPVAQRGLVSGWVGFTQSFGVVVGVIVATALGGASAGYLAIGVLVVLSAVAFAAGTPDQPASAAAPRPGLRDLKQAFRVSPREHPDFAWAWATRFLVQLGNAMATLYLLYFLKDRVHPANADDNLLILILVYTATTLLTVVVGGAYSDRTGRRKRLVAISGYVMAVAAIELAIWPTWPGAVVAAVVLGLGFGVYLSVDQALVTQVLPAASERARDLGIINIANSAPQVLGPALAAPLVAYLGGYPTLYGAVAVVTVLGSVLVHKIRSVP